MKAFPFRRSRPPVALCDFRVPQTSPLRAACCGMYHEIRDVLSSQGRPSHWLIYDANARAGRSAEETIDLVRQYLERVNAFVDYFRSAADQVPNNTAPFAVELTVPPTGGDVAAIIHTDGLRHVDPRRFVIFGRTDPQPQRVPVLSPYYEPLQYPLLFPHGARMGP